MDPRKHITEELKTLNSNLPEAVTHNIFAVPEGYFEGFAAGVLARIHAQNMNAEAELEALSPLLAGISKKNPFSVPEGYFGQLDADRGAIVAEEAYSAELWSVKGITPYSVPVGYFEALPQQILEKTATPQRGKVISLRSWMRMAVAACVAGIIFIAGFQYFDSSRVSVGSQAWMERKLNTVSDKELDEFIQTTDPAHTGVAANTPAANDVRALLKDVSLTEMDAFLEQVPVEDEPVELVN